MNKITGKTRLYAIVADPIHHVKTPQSINRLLEERGIDGVMVALHVNAEQLSAAISGLRAIDNLGGFVVTVPHKTAIISLCDEVTDAAMQIGAANVVRREADGRLVADMLDGKGFIAGLLRSGIAVRDRSVYLAGAGGAANAIAFALAEAGIARLTIGNRTKGKAVDLIQRLSLAYPSLSAQVGTTDPAGHDLVVNATSLGLRAGDPLPLAVAKLSASQTVCEIIMDPADTPLLVAAKEKGCAIQYGAPMLAGQVELMAAFMGAPDKVGQANAMEGKINSSLIEIFRHLLGERGVITSQTDLARFCIDWRQMFRGQALCAVLPTTTGEVAAIVKACAEADVAIVPVGGNTGLSGGATPDGSGTQVVLSMERMNAIRHLDVVGGTMEVQAGCILKVAQDKARDAGLLLPISLAAEGSALIGGILATNAGGINVLRYGMARSRVLGLEVVTADGEVISGLRRLRKDNAGYDWKQVFIGSEGTLGIITAVVLQLAPLPQYRETALLAVPSAEAALRVLQAARGAMDETLNAFELMSGLSMDLVVKHTPRSCPLGPSPWYVLLEASSSLSGLRPAMEEVLSRVLEKEDATDGVVAESGRQGLDLWSLREHMTEAEAREGRSIKHDVSVPISEIPAFLQQTDEALRSAFPDARVNAFGHAGDGNIHYNIIVKPDADGNAINTLVHDIVVRHGGSISAEHGIGQYRVSELLRCRSAPERMLAARLKRALDPAGRMNPGKVFPKNIE